MTDVVIEQSSLKDLVILKLAREIAADIQPLETILKNHSISGKQWETIQSLPRFQQFLAQELEAWGSATNTPERVKIKSAAMIEEALPEMFARVHDLRENLGHKVSLLSFLKDLSGMGAKQAAQSAGGERFSVTINMGAGKTVTVAKDVTPAEPLAEAIDALVAAEPDTPRVTIDLAPVMGGLGPSPLPLIEGELL